MTLGDHSIEKCTICGADLNKSSYNELLEAIERVRELHYPVNDGGCGDPDCCSPSDSEEFCIICTGYEYPCETIKALDGE